eukprot:CAMPEP_0196656424 /NCGR_PEP_ID=MMETSP1086-20130531/17124_1 /TAXON_ID=77921 /ORGANISM="Cyanoptyche  gloeocystis , Strain SAG4.97" /LENGTH=34 /DNA_ID= /DNA_START= /DNA_END= /DNA_ORIENTATION=
MGIDDLSAASEGVGKSGWGEESQGSQFSKAAVAT